MRPLKKCDDMVQARRKLDEVNEYMRRKLTVRLSQLEDQDADQISGDVETPGPGRATLPSVPGWPSDELPTQPERRLRTA